MNKKNSNPLVSIVTPAYNQAEYLAETIESVLAQSYPNIEYIVLDDGSTDHTRQILEKYTGKIRWESHENIGQARTLNKGWSMCTGELLGYLSSDDLLDVDAIATLVDQYSYEPSIVFGDYRLIDQRGTKIKTKKTRFSGYEDMVHTFNCPIGPGAIFSRNLFRDSEGWNPEFRQIPDYDFWIRAGRHAKFVKVDKEIAGFRVHTGSQTFASSTPSKADEAIVCIDQFFNKDVTETRRLNKRRASAAAYVFSSCLHLRSGRYLQTFNRLAQSLFHGSYHAFSPRNIIRLFGTIYSVFRYRYLQH